MRPKLIKILINQSLVLVLLISLLSGCSKSNEDTERTKTIRLLTNDSYKNWFVDQTSIDDIIQPISSCDSSYILTLKADFSWEEAYLKLACYQLNSGTWMLDEGNIVISIHFIDPTSGENQERKFEIIALSEKYFEYQYAENNKLLKVRLKIN